MALQVLSANQAALKIACPIPANKKITREEYIHSENETGSLQDPVFGDLRNKTELDERERASIATQLKQVESSKEWIVQHLDRRVACFFEQLVVCYKTPFHFEIGETAHQGESTETVTKGKQKVKFDSAHSSTIPCLYAYEQTAWDKWKKEGGVKPEGFVYLQDSDTYLLHNSTIGLAKVINQGDIALDGTKDPKTPKLRAKAIDLLNQAAKGELTPEAGLKLFVQMAIEVIDALLPVSDKKCKAEIKAVLRVYREQLRALEQEMREPSFFDRLLDLRIQDGGIRHGVYPLRYKIIRECHEEQSLILQKVKALAKEILNGNAKPKYFDRVFKMILLEKADAKTKLALEKLFCLSHDGLKATLKCQPKTARALIETPENLQKISKLLNHLWEDFWGLKRKELLFRRDLFNHLVSYNRYTQKEVADRYKELYPVRPMSQSGVSRIKNDIKPISQELAREMARVFNVDAGLFMPALFTSLYA